MSDKKRIDKLATYLQKYLSEAHETPNGFAPIEGWPNTFYDGVLWAFGKLVQIYPSEED